MTRQPTSPPAHQHAWYTDSCSMCCVARLLHWLGWPATFRPVPSSLRTHATSGSTRERCPYRRRFPRPHVMGPPRRSDQITLRTGQIKSDQIISWSSLRGVASKRLRAVDDAKGTPASRHAVPPCPLALTPRHVIPTKRCARTHRRIQLCPADFPRFPRSAARRKRYVGPHFERSCSILSASNPAVRLSL